MKQLIFSKLLIIILLIYPLQTIYSQQNTKTEIEYFTIKGCHDCDDILYDIIHSTLKNYLGFTETTEYDLLESEKYEYMLLRLNQLGIQFEGTPFILVNDTYLYGNNLNSENLTNAL